MQIGEPCFWTTLHGFTGDTLLNGLLSGKPKKYIFFQRNMTFTKCRSIFSNPSDGNKNNCNNQKNCSLMHDTDISLHIMSAIF